jgi:hypothetical protein
VPAQSERSEKRKNKTFLCFPEEDNTTLPFLVGYPLSTIPNPFGLGIVDKG